MYRPACAIASPTLARRMFYAWILFLYFASGTIGKAVYWGSGPGVPHYPGMHWVVSRTTHQFCQRQKRKRNLKQT